VAALSGTVQRDPDFASLNPEHSIVTVKAHVKTNIKAELVDVELLRKVQVVDWENWLPSPLKSSDALFLVSARCEKEVSNRFT
jgi:hypothetical protein